MMIPGKNQDRAREVADRKIEIKGGDRVNKLEGN